MATGFCCDSKLCIIPASPGNPLGQLLPRVSLTGSNVGTWGLSAVHTLYAVSTRLPVSLGSTVALCRLVWRGLTHHTRLCSGQVGLALLVASVTFCYAKREKINRNREIASYPHAQVHVQTTASAD